MALDHARVRKYLKESDLRGLFTQELGWEHHQGNLQVTVEAQDYTLPVIAQKRGMVAYQCPTDDIEEIPDYATRRKIERQVARSVHEHIVVFTNADQEVQVWQWVKREAGRPAACREHTYHTSQPGDALIQKLGAIEFTLEEEEDLTIVDVAGRTRAAFDVDRMTRRFYDRFKTEHAAFLKFIKGIPSKEDREWYASLMLNRLMFVYFIQKKGFLDGDTDYLRNRLRMMRQLRGKDKFLSFYRHFLLRLFHEGLGGQNRTSKLDELLGTVPYLNGGLFDVHELEEHNQEIAIPDKAFEKLFDFFDAYQWHLDERPLRKDDEINPDVLGYIFEKYINQKQMGAYYTKEDITDYIAKNTIAPFLFDAAEKKCAVAFEPDSAMWRLLKENPDRYIYDAVRHGVIGEEGQVISLPKEIAAGLDDVSKRDGWNRPADAACALPTETWREHVARRRRCLELREKLAAGEVHAINDLITLNLDIRQFAQDAIENCEGPELLRAFFSAISTVSVLDPTCGSGAFLFAALNILEPLYEACLDRMDAFVEDLDRSGGKASPRKFEDFRKTLDQVARHPNERYFILKSIIIGNLFGVDIMEEAVEICKLRLFLKLVAQVDTVDQVEPLPDIDFNIRPGNTLVGFTSLGDVEHAIKQDPSGQGKLLTSDDEEILNDIRERAHIADRAYQQFRRQQTELGGTVTAEDKQELRRRLSELSAELDEYLAGEYGVDPADQKVFDKWRASHQPLHWFAEFYGTMMDGGFDVVIGNPPYVEYSKVRKTYRIMRYKSESCGNLYAMCAERSYTIMTAGGRFGFIVQAPVASTNRMQHIRDILRDHSDLLACSTYDDRPSKLFDGMHHCRLAILIARTSTGRDSRTVATTRYHKWYTEERPHVFATLQYIILPEDCYRSIIPKFRCQDEIDIFRRVKLLPKSLGDLFCPTDTDYRVYYKITGVGHWFNFALAPPKFWRDGVEGNSTREKSVSFRKALLRDTAYCCLYSNLHYWLYQARTNCRDFNPSDIKYLPIPDSVAEGVEEFRTLARRIMEKLEETSDVGTATYSVGGTVSYQRFKPKTAKECFDEVDTILANHCGFSEEQLDFIVNYDIKYRMGEDHNGD